MAIWSKTLDSVNRESTRAWVRVTSRTRAVMRSDSGQGTTEYAILVGVLVVIAILAIMVFRPKLETLWNAIADGINGL